MKRLLILLPALFSLSTSFADDSPLDGTPTYAETMKWITDKLAAYPYQFTTYDFGERTENTVYNELSYSGCHLKMVTTTHYQNAHQDYRDTETVTLSLRDIDPEVISTGTYRNTVFVWLNTLGRAALISKTRCTTTECHENREYRFVFNLLNGEVNLPARMKDAFKHVKALCPYIEPNPLI